MPNQQSLICQTSDGIAIYTEPGRKSDYDFRVRYREPGKRIRTPQHIHIIVDLYQKRGAERGLTNDFADHIINRIIGPVVPATSYPPSLQVFETSHISLFEGLIGVSEYSPEFLLVVIELIMIQERTNYPNGTLNLQLFQNSEIVMTFLAWLARRHSEGVSCKSNPNTMPIVNLIRLGPNVIPWRRMTEDSLHIDTDRMRHRRELIRSQGQSGHNLTVQTTIDMARTQT